MKAFIEQFKNPLQMRAVFTAGYRHAEKALETGAAYELVVRRSNKSRDQEEHYHALIGDISDQYVHYGRKFDPEDMKRLLVAAFKHETKDDEVNYPGFKALWAQMGDLRIVPALTGDGFVTLGDQTRKFPRKLACGFINWLYSFMYENKVHCTNPKYQPEQARAAA